MNKAISTALLLAAGTALANATPSGTVATDYDTSVLNSYTWTDVSSSAIYTAKLDTGNAQFLNDGVSYAYDEYSWKLGFTVGETAGNVRGFFSTSSKDFSGPNTTASGMTLSYTYSDGSFTYSLNGFRASEATSTNSSLVRITSTSSDISLIWDAVNSVATIASGNSSASVSVSNPDELLSLTGGASQGYGVARVWTNSGSETFSSATLSVSAVPEPSSFGLLAGLGALALVAARRRRSRKA